MILFICLFYCCTFCLLHAAVLICNNCDIFSTNYPLHGSIASVTAGSLPVHITLNRLPSPFNPEANQSRIVSSQLQNDLTSSNQQRLNTSLSTDANVHQRSTPDLNRAALFVGQSKNNTNLTSQTKVISSQTIIQQGTPIKTGIEFFIATNISSYGLFCSIRTMKLYVT